MKGFRARPLVWLSVVGTAALAYFAPSADEPVRAVERPHLTDDRTAPNSESPVSARVAATAPQRAASAVRLLSLRARDDGAVDERFFWAPSPAAPVGPMPASAPDPLPSFPYTVSGRFVDGDKTFFLLSHGDDHQAAALGDIVASHWRLDALDGGSLAVVDTDSGRRVDISLGETS